MTRAARRKPRGFFVAPRFSPASFFVAPAKA
jgi:hypothetical protein